MSNIIEEFVIKFLTDSKEAKKGAQEIDKLLDSVGKKQVKRATTNAKVENKAHKTMLAKKLKDEATYGRDSRIQAEKARKAWERREKIKSIMPNNQLANKSAQGSASVFEKSFKEEAKQSEKLSEMERKRWVDKQKRRAANRRQREDDRRQEEDSYRKSLNNRLKAFKASKQKERKLTEDIDKQAAMIRRTAGFKLAGRMGESGKYDSEIQRLVDKKDLAGLRNLRYEMSDVRENMTRYRKSLRKTNIAQKGLTDSTRNMIRSYASLYAIFEGTTAIKRVGMDFQSMRASMLAASTDQEDAAKKLKFVEENAYRLGVNLREATRAYMQLSIAGKDVLSDTQIKELFVSTLEVSTALGMSIDDTKGTFRSFVQMLSKG